MDKRYKTRDGRDVRVLCVDLKNDNYPVLSVVTNKDGFQIVIQHSSDGHYYEDGEDSDVDLIEQPEEHTIDVWAVLYKKDDWIKGVTEIFRKEQDAKDYAYHRGFGVKAMKKFTLKLTEGDTLKEGEME